MPESCKVDAPCILRFDGPQKISDADSVRIRLNEAISTPGDLVIDCGSVTEADLSFVQLLLSARRSARARAKSLRLSAPAAGPLLDTLRRGGFVHPAEDSPPLADDSFWMEAAP